MTEPNQPSEAPARRGLRYLDHAATTPVRPEVLAAMEPFYVERFGNPASVHTVGESAKAALTEARTRVARLLGLRPGDVIFTSGGSESNNTAIKGITLAALRARGARHLITTPIEHESILESADYLQRWHDVEVTQVRVDEMGRVNPGAVAAAVRSDTAMVSIGYANNEVGTTQDLPAIAAAVAQASAAFEGSRPILHTDAVQAAGWLPLTPDAVGEAALTLAGHKIGAPKGTGVLALRGRVPLEPLIHGGGQQRGRRSGTEDVAGAVGFATALELAERERVQTVARTIAVRDEFIAGVLALVPGARLTGEPFRRLPGNASFTFAGVSGEAVLLELERRGVVSSSGSACAAGSDEPSHVLIAMGISPEVARTAVRITFGHHVADLNPGRLARIVAESVAAV